jgi:SAM-dependent methyltransferase
MKGFDHGQLAAEYWNRRSQTFHCSWRDSTYAGELMSRMELRPEYSVLDVGCGCGAMAIPLASKVNRVTALDISPVRLEKLLHKAAAGGLTNITTVNQDWNQAAIGKEIQKHDIVLVSRSVHALFFETLRKINLASNSACYITWRAERLDEFETELAEAMGKNLPLYPDYSVICEMLCELGIFPGTETFETESQEKYPSLQEALLSMARGTEINGRQYTNLLTIARKRLTRNDNHYSFSRKIKWVLISWKN